MNIRLRDAEEGDLGAINAIYNHYVTRSTCTYQTEPSTEAERQTWWDVRRQGGYPMIVAVEEGTERVVGWGSLQAFHPRAAYRFTVENSVYIDAAYQRRGLGRMILGELLKRAGEKGYRSIIALISADQEASVRLHAAMGFREAGKLMRVGFKFERWLDVVYMQWEAEGRSA